MNALDALYVLLAGASAPVWMRKQRGGWGERFGRIEPLHRRDGAHPARARIMLHAVSVGEVGALRTLVPLLTAEADVLVTASTDTGLVRAKNLFASTARVRRYPLDFSWAVRRFLDATRPDAVGLVELEVWPNFVRECERRGIPVAVINGRLSARSFRGYRRIRPWMRGTFARLSWAAAQTEEYAARFRAMGVPGERVSVTDTMKWDAARIEDSVPGAEELAAAMGIDRTRPLVVAGSTGPGEEALLHAACPPGAQLLCAPRQPERFDEAQAALPGCVRRTSPGQGHARADSGRFLLDTIGELRQAYALADVVVVGRSFGGLYGSDPIEPIALGKATVIGPAFDDFASVVHALRDEDGLAVVAAGDLPGVLADLVRDPQRRGRMAQAGRACIRRHQGASHRHAEILLRLAAGAGRTT